MNFTGASSTDPNGDPLTYSWNFGDGTTGTGATVSHTFTSEGKFNVTLTVNDRPNNAGLSNTSQPIAVTVNSVLPAGFQETMIATGLNQASSIAMAPDGRIFVAEKDLDIRIIQNGQLLPTPFANLASEVDSTADRGIQTVLLDPNFATNGFVYVYYTHVADSSGTAFDRLVRFHASPTNPNVADSSGETVIFDTDSSGNHLLPSACPAITPAVRCASAPTACCTSGSATSIAPSNTFNLASDAGKLLRLNVENFQPGNFNSLIPSNNPYVNTAGARPEIYAMGLRNPFTGDMLPGTNTFYMNDVGAGSWEEIDVAAPQANYGWPTAEGTSTNPAFTNPIYEYAHVPVGGVAAITGGAFYTGSAFPSSYSGSYFFSDFDNDWIHNLNPATGVETNFETGADAPVSMIQASDGSLYYVSHGLTEPDSVFRISYTGNLAPTAAASATSATSGARR